MSRGVDVRPRFTIGLPVRNGEPYLVEAIESIRAQTCPDFELIISDNASTDGTEAVCRAYEARDRRIRYLRRTADVGVSQNFNDLVAHANAPYFKWASSDDVIAPELLARCGEVLDREPTIVLVHSKVQSIGPRGEILPRHDDSRLQLMQDAAADRLGHLFDVLCFCDAQYGVMRVDALRRTRLFGDFVGSDICLLAELCLFGKFFELPEPLLSRRFHDQAASSLAPQDLLEHYGLKGRGVALYYWRHLWANAGAVLGAPIGAGDQVRAMRVLARWAIWRRWSLVQELGIILRHVTGRPYAPLSAGRTLAPSEEKPG